MGTVKIRHLVRKGAGWYWQPSRTALAAGFRAEALGRNQAEAIRRAVPRSVPDERNFSFPDNGLLYSGLGNSATGCYSASAVCHTGGV